MGMFGMSEFERQMLINQSVIMGFLHGVFLDRIASWNENSYNGLLSCFQITKGMLDADDRLKQEVEDG